MTTRFRKLTIAASIAATLSAGFLPAQAANNSEVASLFEQINVEYEKFTLENGLTTIVIPDHSTPEVSIAVFLGIGSKNEPDGKSGFAHLYEHLMFQGSEHAPGEYFNYLGQVGASDYNGSTSFDYTNYYETVPTGAVDRMLWLEGDRMANITGGITQDVLDEQKAVVKNEKRQGESGPDAQLFDIYLSEFYPEGHPYHHSVIGSMEDIGNASLDDVHNWYKDYYGASNAYLVIAGDISIADAKAKVKKYFSDVHPGVPAKRIHDVPTFTEIKRIEVHSEASPATSISRAWHLPEATHKDTILLRFMATALAKHPESPLVKRLKDELKYVTDISFSVRAQSVSSTASLDFTVREEADVSIEAINQVIDEELEKFFKKGPDMDILRRQQLSEDAAFVRDADNVTSLARTFVYFEMLAGNPEFFKTARQWEMSASKKELRNIAEQWLSKPYFEMTIHAKPDTQAMAVEVDRSKMPSIKETLQTVEFPEFQQATLDNGMKVVLIEDDKLPVVDLTFSIKGGRAAEEKYGYGTANLVVQNLEKGTRKWDEETLNKKGEDIALKYNKWASAQNTLLNFNTLTPYLDETLEIAGEVLQNPTFPESELEEAREHIQLQYQSLKNDPSKTSRKLFNQLLFGKTHQQGKIHTLEERLAGAERKQLMALHKAQFGPNNTTVWVSGNISLKNLTDKLNTHFGKWKPVKAVEDIQHAPAKPMLGKVILIDQPKTPSSTLMFGQLTPKFDVKYDGVDQLMNGVIGGYFGSRINMNIREDKGWSYGTKSQLRTTSEDLPGRLFVNTKVQTDKTVEAIQEVLKEFNAYIDDKPATQAELDKYRDGIVKSLPARYSNNSAYLQTAMSAENYGLPFNHNEKEGERLTNTTLKQVNQYAKDIIKTDEFVYLIIGDLSKIESSIRTMKLGEIEVWDSLGNKIR